MIMKYISNFQKAQAILYRAKSVNLKDNIYISYDKSLEAVELASKTNWFDPALDVPDNYSYVLVFTKKDERYIMSFVIDHFSCGALILGIEQIKAWCYLPVFNKA